VKDSKILDCYCGGKPLIHQRAYYDGWLLACRKCSRKTREYKKRELAIRGWNNLSKIEVVCLIFSKERKARNGPAPC
jgi:hypothetical protein